MKNTPNFSMSQFKRYLRKSAHPHLAKNREYLDAVEEINKLTSKIDELCDEHHKLDAECRGNDISDETRKKYFEKLGAIELKAMELNAQRTALDVKTRKIEAEYTSSKKAIRKIIESIDANIKKYENNIKLLEKKFEELTKHIDKNLHGDAVDVSEAKSRKDAEIKYLKDSIESLKKSKRVYELKLQEAPKKAEKISKSTEGN